MYLYLILNTSRTSCYWFFKIFNSGLFPLTTYEWNVSTFKTFLFQHKDHTSICCGYFNLPNIKWTHDGNRLIYSLLSAILTPCVPQIFAYNCFHQNIFILNKFNSLLDFIFKNTDNVNVDLSPNLFCFVGSISFTIIFYYYTLLSYHFFHNFHKANYFLISFIASFDWQSTFFNRDVHSAADLFMDTLYDYTLLSYYVFLKLT